MNLQTFFKDFSDLDRDNIGSWPIHVKGVIWVITLLLFSFLTYQFGLSDALKELKVKKLEEMEMMDHYEKSAFQAVNLSNLKKEYASMQASFSILVKQLPSSTEVPGLLEDISRFGSGGELGFKKIALGDEKVVEFYAELPIQITVRGGYHSLASFASGVASLSRIVTLHDFSIAPVSGGDSKLGSGSVLEASILAKTYRYNQRN